MPGGTLFWPTVGIFSVNLVIAAAQIAMALCKMRRKVLMRNQHARWRHEKESIEVHTICNGTLEVNNQSTGDKEHIWVEYIKSLDAAEEDTTQVKTISMESVVVLEDEDFENFEMIKSEEGFGVGLERIFDQHISGEESSAFACTNDEINTNNSV